MNVSLYYKYFISPGIGHNGETLFTTWAAGAQGQRDKSKVSQNKSTFATLQHDEEQNRFVVERCEKEHFSI